MTGTSPEHKYEEDGGPSLRRIAALLQAASTPDSLDTFLRAVTTNVLIGNGDAHAKNFSLLHHASGALTLVRSTTYCARCSTAMAGWPCTSTMYIVRTE